MSIDQPIHFVKQYTDTIMHLAQQKFPRFRGSVRMVPHTVGEETFIDQIGLVQPTVREERHSETKRADTPMRRRQIEMRTYDASDFVDKPDMLKTLNDPTNDIAIAFGQGFARQFDDITIASFLADAKTGKDGNTTVAFDTTNFQIGLGDGDGMTMAKLINTNRILRAAENDPDQGFFISVSQRQIADMLGDSQFTSADYNAMRTLMMGEINTFLGFTWIPSERLPKTGSERSCIAWAKNTVGLLIGQEPSVRIDELATHNYSTQVFMTATAGGSRLEETGVVDIRCTEP